MNTNSNKTTSFLIVNQLTGLSFDKSHPNHSLLRLLLLSFACIAGITGSLFVVSALTVVPNLQFKGNSFLASLFIGNLLITSLVLPSVCVSILSGGSFHVSGLLNEWCFMQWKFLQSYLIIFFYSFFLISLDCLLNFATYLRIYSLILINFLVWFFAFFIIFFFTFVLNLIRSEESDDSLLTFVDFFPEEICSTVEHKSHRQILLTSSMVIDQEAPEKSQANDSDQNYSLMLVFGIPIVLTLICFLGSLFKKPSPPRNQLHHFNHQQPMSLNPSPSFSTFNNNSQFACNPLTKIHFIVFCVSLVMTLPLVVSSSIKTSPKKVIPSFFWSTVIFSIISPFLYAFLTREFSESFLQLFYYCCCKSHINWNSRNKNIIVYGTQTMSSSTVNQGSGQSSAAVFTHPVMHHAYHHSNASGGVSFTSGVSSGGNTFSGGGNMTGGSSSGGPFRAFRSRGGPFVSPADL